jgi:hypothetical protein
MDRERLKTHLHEAEAHIARAEERVAKQRRFIAMLEQDGQDTPRRGNFSRSSRERARRS